MAPVLLLFLMLAVSQTMKTNWKYKTPTCGHFKSNKWNRSGRLKNQNYRTKGDLLEMFHLIFVDDSALFLSHYNTCKLEPIPFTIITPDSDLL
jgi:hypothetical protein